MTGSIASIGAASMGAGNAAMIAQQQRQARQQTQQLGNQAADERQRQVALADSAQAQEIQSESVQQYAQAQARQHSVNLIA